MGQMVESAPGVVEEPTLLVAYQVLANRWMATRALLWQIPAPSLAAQAFLIGTAGQLAGRWMIAVLLAISVVVIGLASIFVQYRTGQTAALD